MSEELKKGASFIFEATDPEQVFTYEDFEEEDLMFAKTAKDFSYNEVIPLAEEIEEHDRKIPINVELMKKAGELGLLMVEIPEEFGGLGKGLSSAMLVAESCAQSGSFTTTMMCHTGIGTLPILYFGTREQKEKYLPMLASGESVGAYCLTEEGFGSDALGAKTRAVRSECGKYWILNGTKQFITNAGFADIFTVYAKVDGEHFTCFLVCRDDPGLSTGSEEHKMGIRGSSTRQVIMEDCKIPIDRMVGELGKGHRVALNILNLGRLKLGLGSLGAMKELVRYANSYAAERKQFGKTINNFQLIKEKLVNMLVDIYITESMAYRTSGMMDKAISKITIPHEADEFYQQKVNTIEEYAIEASILKVFGSECLARTVDEAVQVLGGYGFSEEYGTARAYRDARINRIFEGTNEINRMLMMGQLMRRAMKGQIDLMTPIMTLMNEVKNDAVKKDVKDGLLGREITAVEIMRKWATFGIGVPAQKAMANPKFLEENQILLRLIADVMMDVYAADSCLLRALKIAKTMGEEKAKIAIALTKVVVYERLRRVMENVRQICANTAVGDDNEFAKNTKAMTRMTFDYALDTMTLKTELYEHLRDRTVYDLF